MSRNFLKTNVRDKIIPNGWSMERLGSIANITTGKKDVNEGHSDGFYPFFTCSQKEYKIEEYSFDTEAILVAGNAYFNVKYYKGKFDAYQRTYVIDGFKDNIARYVYHVLSKDVKKLTTNNQGSAVKYIKLKDLTTFQFLLPPAKEREKIVRILSIVEQVIDATQAIIDQTQLLKKGLMQELFTHGIPGRHKKFKKTEIGKIPEEWELVKLGEECAVTKLAGFEFTKFFKYKKDGEIIALRALNIKGDELDLKNIHTIDQSISDALPRSKLYEGDIVLTYIGANIGDALRIPKSNKYHLAPNIAKITPTEEFRSWFLLRVLQSDIVQRQIRLLTAITATPSLTMTQIRTIKVSKPSPTEQEKITHIASLFIERIKREEEALLKLHNLKSALMQVLLSGEVRVKV